jgi:hypothetical protein
MVPIPVAPFKMHVGLKTGGCGPAQKNIYCCDTGQPKKRKEMDWAFPLFFLEASPKQVFTEKENEKGEKNWRLFGRKKKKTRFFVPKSSLSFQGEERGVLLTLQKTLPGFFFLFFLRCLDFIFVCRLLLASSVAKVCCWPFQYKCVFLEFRVTKRLAFHISVHISVAVQVLLDKLNHVQ